MSNLFKLICAVCFFVLSISLTSCGDDETCYVCTGFDDGTTELEDLGTVCEGDDDGTGGVISVDELEAAVQIYEALGGTCVKQ